MAHSSSWLFTMTPLMQRQDQDHDGQQGEVARIL